MSENYLTNISRISDRYLPNIRQISDKYPMMLVKQANKPYPRCFSHSHPLDHPLDGEWMTINHDKNNKDDNCENDNLTKKLKMITVMENFTASATLHRSTMKPLGVISRTFELYNVSEV